MFHTIIVDRVDTTGVKAYFSISVVFAQAKDLNDVTDPQLHFVPMFQLFLEAQTSTKNSMEYGIYNQLVSKIEDFERNGSGWIIQLLLHLDLSLCSCVVYLSLLLVYLFHLSHCLSICPVCLSIWLYIYIYIFYLFYYNYNFILDMTVYDPIHASSYLPLPQILKSKKALINI